MELIITDKIVKQVISNVEWYRNQLNEMSSDALMLPKKMSGKNGMKIEYGVHFSLALFHLAVQKMLKLI